MDNAGLLSGNQSAPSVWKRHQNRRGSKIEIGSIGIGTVDPVSETAGRVPGIGGEYLAGPQGLARIHVKRNERVAAARGWIAVVVSGGHINRVPFYIDSRARPDGRA